MSIENEIRKAIEKQGYMCIDELMRIAMSASADSYYRSKQPLGADADFLTSPEISQMFGEMIGLWCVDIWEKMGKPNPVNIAELGPGRGLLMRDLLRATKNAPGFHEALQIQMLEINPLLIEEQKSQLQGATISWIDSINKISELPTIFIANEFFDALPIRQYIKIKKDWHEIALVIDPNDGMLRFDKRPMMPRIFAGHIDLAHIKAGDGAIIEESQESIETIRSICTHIKKYRGGALIVDYGYDVPPLLRLDYQYMSTLQAIKRHNFVPVLSSLGEADLSAHVDFYYLSQIATAQMVRVEEIQSQGDFLRNFGIEARLKSLQDKNPELKDVLERQVIRLTAEEQMGKLFKVLELHSIR